MAELENERPITVRRTYGPNDGLVVDEWPQRTRFSAQLLAEGAPEQVPPLDNPAFIETVITVRVSNGVARYRVVGIESFDDCKLIAERIPDDA